MYILKYNMLMIGLNTALYSSLLAPGLQWALLTEQPPPEHGPTAAPGLDHVTAGVLLTPDPTPAHTTHPPFPTPPHPPTPRSSWAPSNKLNGSHAYWCFYLGLPTPTMLDI